ncbi:hypothetical protein MMC09_004210 [Bachmanniomyces sp. S44760]|nr:hypothetical protein [Bachmanniomyces sp. S44760]
MSYSSSYSGSYHDPDLKHGYSYDSAYAETDLFDSPYPISPHRMTANLSQRSDGSSSSTYAQSPTYFEQAYDYPSTSGATRAESPSTEYFQPYESNSHRIRRSEKVARKASSSSKDKSFVCLTPNCTSKAVFTRAADLDRHMQTVHIATKMDCPHQWCGRQGQHGFTRKDHLRDHLRQVHMKDLPKGRRKG